MQADLSDPAAVVWRPDAAMVEGANLTRFMRALGVESFEALNAHASQDPAGFHDALRATRAGVGRRRRRGHHLDLR
jgi:acetyl-CoA synthetase